jgi:type I restriction enzyme S subunit
VLRAGERAVLAAVERSGHGTCKLNTKVLESLAIPLPPLAEQKRIVAKVHELMALCDRLEAQQKAREEKHGKLARAGLARFADAPTPANLGFLFHDAYTLDPAELRKLTLTLAVQGKLTSRGSAPPEDTLGSILAEASINGVSKGPTSDNSATEILRISAGTSRDDFYVDEDDFKFVELPEDEVGKYRLQPNDLLACRFNGNLHFVGRFSLYRGTSGRVQVNPDKLIRFRVKSEQHDPRYVCYAMNAAPMRLQIESMCATTAGNIGLSAGKLKTVTLPLPPLAEQRRIVAKVDQLMALVDQLEAQLAESRTAAERLMEAVAAELTSAATSKRSAPAEIARAAPAADLAYLPGLAACYIADALRGDENLGRTKLEKVSHFIEYHAGVPLGRRPKPYLYGPVDYEQLKKAEAWATEQGAFMVSDPGDRAKVTYAAGPKLSELARRAAEQFGERKAEVDRIIGLLRHESTRRCEIFATVYAAWNDLLLRGVYPTDPAIMDEIRENWHERKQSFRDKEWRVGLNWLRLHNLVPTGTGRPVARPAA